MTTSVLFTLLDAVCSSEDPVGGDEAASTDVPPAPTAVRLERDLSRVGREQVTLND